MTGQSIGEALASMECEVEKLREDNAKFRKEIERLSSLLNDAVAEPKKWKVTVDAEHLEMVIAMIDVVGLDEFLDDKHFHRESLDHLSDSLRNFAQDNPAFDDRD